MPDRPILVIDDDPEILDTVVAILIDEGYAVERASNGAEGLAVLEACQAQVVLLDMRMPVLDGWGFARAVQHGRRSVRIVVMTAAQDARRWATEIAAYDYLAKPFDLLDLLAVVERASA
jgi:DNA-binding NtrC family response regulator